ncbi:alpha-1,4-glucan--maltose-1-phosphate maltosyltransferase [Acidiferrobacter sp.]|uniref:alpha-1,4-glucan--maltose-1-phosphate maltosyltransferase n=1 Tax=Acidiferrobacter sp. TaxID=1872107 RepID=UPI00262ECCFE|nr:alpha-1,4-glucan--maltose-1-phosphate maltosyltransferase [Acidiferrobacter sp.]
MARRPVKGPPLPSGGQHRVVIEALSPMIDCGRYPIKRVVGDTVIVEADVLADGHDAVACMLCIRKPGAATASAVRMTPLGNDRYRGRFVVSELGVYRYTVRAHIDRFGSLVQELSRRPADDPDLALVLQQAAVLIARAADHAPAREARALRRAQRRIEGPAPLADRCAVLQDEGLAERVLRFTQAVHETVWEPELAVRVDPERARASAWYEFFPRSMWGAAGGRLRDADPILAAIAGMGFDVVYLPPLSPIGTVGRKGPNNTVSRDPADVGSPWAVGSAEGGHKTVAAALGTVADFRAFCRKAEGLGLSVAVDLAFQCAPDHPYVTEHPQWFRHRPDGTIQYAENPPKKYQDIYPLDFETEDWQALWRTLHGIVQFWIDAGVRIFRVDNPHTKAFAFWEWLIETVRADYPETLFLAEAFTRPKVMYRLAKLGFTHSYTYFTWRNSKRELTAYFTQLHSSPLREYFRAHLWPNTPDILPLALQHAPRAAFIARLVLAATLSANYGIYGPAFEFMESQPRAPGSEDYQNSEKYERRTWDFDRQDSLRAVIARINAIRRAHPALLSDAHLTFHAIDNDNLIAYSKTTDDGASVILVVVNLDPYHRQAGWVEWPAPAGAGRPVQMHELLSDARYLWNGGRHYVELVPEQMPAHIFRPRAYVGTEHDFDYYV